MGDFYSLFVPKQAVGASLKYFDLFNASGSASYLNLHYCVPIISGAVAVSGLLGVDLFLQRSTAVGTGGTAATLEGTDPTACTISGWNGSPQLNSKITARLTPTGGATAGAVLDMVSVFTEETNSAAYTPTPNMARVLGLPDLPPIKIDEGSGIIAVQGSVASVGNIAWSLLFEVVRK
jgi:hypothetical protein